MKSLEIGKENAMYKKIDWTRRNQEERDYYNYYRSLGYDEQTAVVLALFTYGQHRTANIDMDTRYRMILEQIERDARERDQGFGWRRSIGTHSYSQTYTEGASYSMPSSLPDSCPIPYRRGHRAAMQNRRHRAAVRNRRQRKAARSLRRRCPVCSEALYLPGRQKRRRDRK